MIRVILIDDHTLFRMGLAELLEHAGISIVATTGDGQEGIRLTQALQPDVVLLDLRMPEVDGISVLKKMRELRMNMPIAMLTTSTFEKDLTDALRAGAQGYLLKDMEPDELVDALKDIVQGKTVVAPELASTLAKIVRGVPDEPATPAAFSDLTPREREILCHIAEGQSNKVIGKKLGISDGTVKLHVKSILRKLSVHSRVEAAVIAVEQNLRGKDTFSV